MGHVHGIGFATFLHFSKLHVGYNPMQPCLERACRQRSVERQGDRRVEIVPQVRWTNHGFAILLCKNVQPFPGFGVCCSFVVNTCGGTVTRLTYNFLYRLHESESQ